MWRSNLDGSDALMQLGGLDNPNAVAVMDGQIYVIDSRAKSLSTNYPGEPRNASLYVTDVLDQDWNSISETVDLQVHVISVHKDIIMQT